MKIITRQEAEQMRQVIIPPQRFEPPRDPSILTQNQKDIKFWRDWWAKTPVWLMFIQCTLASIAMVVMVEIVAAAWLFSH